MKLDEWPADANDLTVRLNSHFSRTTWLVDDGDPTCAECGQPSPVRFQISERLWRCMACEEQRG